MTSIQPINGNGICKAEEITEIETSIVDLSNELTRSNDALDDLNFALDTVTERHRVYREKSKAARDKMRRLSSEL